MTRELQPTHEDSGIEWPPSRNHIRCMAHIIRLALGAFMKSLGVKGYTRTSEAHEWDQQCGENEHIDNGKSQKLRTEGNATINQVLAIRPGLAKIIVKLHTSRYFENPESDLHNTDNAWCIDYTDTCWPKRVHCMSKYQSLGRSATAYGCEVTLELDTGVDRVGLLITGIHTQVASTSKYSEYRPLFTTQDEWTIVT
jgi:hypothetical protein